MAEKFSRPVLNAQDLAHIVEGLHTYAEQWRDTASSSARSGDAEEAGILLAMTLEIEELEQRLRTLLDTMVQELIDAQIAESLHTAQEDDSLPMTDEVGTIPLPEPNGDEE